MRAPAFVRAMSGPIVWMLVGLAVQPCTGLEIVTVTLDQFEETFGLHYENDRSLRIQRLQESVKAINDQNTLFDEGKSTFTGSLNEFSAMTEDELEQMKGLIPSNVEESQGNQMLEDRIVGSLDEGKISLDWLWKSVDGDQDRFEDAIKKILQLGIKGRPELMEKPVYMDHRFRLDGNLDGVTPPDSFDEVDKGLVTVPKFQGYNCGSCTVFTSMSLYETCQIKAGMKKQDDDFSEQYLMDCSGRKAACNGATIYYYPRYMVNKLGVSQIPQENSYPYKGKQGTCKDTGPREQSAARIDKIVEFFHCGEERMKKLLVAYGSLSVGISTCKSFHYYASGVYSGCKFTAYSHVVVLVGYGVSNGINFWRIKNSWGTSWGESGYGKIRRGTNEQGIEKGECLALSCSVEGSAMSCNLGQALGDDSFTGEITGRKGHKLTCWKSQCYPKYKTHIDACVYYCGTKACTTKVDAGR